MEAVRLMNGQEHSTVEHKDIAALLESLCEHPLTDGRTEPSPELAAFCREAAKALSQAGAARAEGSDIADAGPPTAALEALLSGADRQAARRSVADAMLRCAAARLDAQSALAFVAAIERSPQSAPARLVEEMLAGDIAEAARSAAPRTRTGIANIWSLIVGGSWSARRWRMAAVCTVLLMAGAASVYRMQMNPAMEGAPPSPMVETSSKPAAIAPAPPPPALATMQPCEARSVTGEAIKAQDTVPADDPTPMAPATVADCAPTPGRALAGRRADEIEALAKQAAKVGAAQADRSGPALGATDRSFPAPARTAPAAAPATRPPGSAGQR